MLTGKPETLKAEVKDEGPGMGITFIDNFRASLTSKYPGSEILGVPASEINPTLIPDCILLIIFSTMECSLNL